MKLRIDLRQNIQLSFVEAHLKFINLFFKGYEFFGLMLYGGQSGGIAFQDVHFTYPNAAQPSLNGVSFNIEPGEHDPFGLSTLRERVALIGGDMHLDSSGGTGSKVVIAVPAGPVR